MTETKPAAVDRAVAFEGVCPILRVASVKGSLDFYVTNLGFKIDWTTALFASVSRGRTHISLPASKTLKICRQWA